MGYAKHKELVRISCNTCLLCRACFSAPPWPSREVAKNVVDDVREKDENNIADELATPRKRSEGRVVARMQAKLLMAAQSSKPWDWLTSHSLDVLGTRYQGTKGGLPRGAAEQFTRSFGHKGCALCQ